MGGKKGREAIERLDRFVIDRELGLMLSVTEVFGPLVGCHLVLARQTGEEIDLQRYVEVRAVDLVKRPRGGRSAPIDAAQLLTMKAGGRA